jgi:L-alanine-DL-glutamate epimerase-like enolase superfamily enzyme
MKISDVRAYTLSAPLKKPWKIAGMLMKEMTATIVEVETGDGLIGYGEALTRLGPSATTEIIDSILKPVLVAYASSIMLQEENEMVKDAVDLVSQGFQKIKVKVGFGVERDSKNIKAIRDAVGPDIGIMVDANCGYSLEAALRFGKIMETLDVIWFEEPVPPYDLEGYEKLNSTLRIPVVAGECEFTRWGFRDLILRGKVPIIQPDIARCGGFTEGRKIGSLASTHDITVAPHTGASGAVCIAAAVQFSASLSNFHIYEHMFPENPLREDILKEPVLECKEGFVHVPEGPGLGIEIDPGKLKRYLRS